MTIEKALFRFAGVMVMISALLTLFHSPLWAWFTLFIGFNAFQSTFTGICPPGWIMRKMGMKSEKEMAAQS